MIKDVKYTWRDSEYGDIFSFIIRLTTTANVAANTTKIDGQIIFVSHESGGGELKRASNLYYTFEGTKYTLSSSYDRVLAKNVENVLGTFTHTVTHDEGGSKSVKFGTCGFDSSVPVYYSDTYASVRISDIYINETVVLPSFAATFITADNFTDESNPTITYNPPSGATKVEACISFTGGNDDIAYREISATGSSYTFELTEDERNVLRVAAIDAQTITVRFYLRTTNGGKRFFNYVNRTLTVVNCNPVLSNPTVRDVNSTTLALTGDENVLIKYASMAEYGVDVTVSKMATIANQYIQNGSKKITGLSYGVIDDPESGLFIFSVTDSRGLTTTATVEKTMLDYVKPTCYQNLSIELDGETETSATVTLKVNGNYFNGTFGDVSNTLKIEVRHTQNDGTMGNWVDLTSGLIPTFNGHTYELVTTISGFLYNQAYDFQCRVTDKLYTVQSAVYTLRSLPVFDWGENDFNFNVPVNIEADSLSMHGGTVLRHNKTANNTVLSATGGHIYVRPGGTDDTYSETIFYPDGRVNFSGEVTVNGEPITAAASADYIVETGTESMGSNGTWYWEKWNSGKAVCWGCRNFGRMQITTASGSLYKSSSQFSQSLPSGLFNANPEVISMEMHDYADGGAEYCAIIRSGYFNSATQVTFQPFLTRSLTTVTSYIGFHIIGRWK